MEKLSINNPCKENWNTFEKRSEGGFCQSCKKTVVDFTNKSNDEIREMLHQKSNEKVCGKFAIGQIESYNISYKEWYSSNSTEMMQSRFVWALVLAFGISLFNLQTGHSQEILGEISIPNVIENNSPPDSIQSPFVTDTTEIYEEIMGDISLEPDTTLIDSTKKTIKEICKKPPVFKNPIDYPYIMGMVVQMPEPKIEVVKEETVKPPKPVIAEQSIGYVFPNPTASATTLFLNIQVKEIYQVYLYNSNGKICSIVLEKELELGSIELPINLTEFDKGSYYISIVSASHQSTLQVIKN